MLYFYFLLISSLTGINCQSSSYYCGSTTNYYGTNGTIRAYGSPNYMNSVNCTYNWHVPSLSSVSLTILSLGIERCGSTCPCDWVELSCRSHSVNLPTRYCGTGSNLNPITFTPCTQIVIWFQTDSSVTGIGYTISYRADPIECLGNCAPVSNSYGYVCPCDTNQTNIMMPTMHPNPQCMGGCILNSDYNSINYCICSESGSTYTTTTTPPPTGCNQTLTASYGIVTSPNYPNAYTRGIDCYQYIAVPMATSIKIQVLDIYVYYSSSYSCEYDYIEITGCDGSTTQFCTSYTLPSNELVFHCTEHTTVTVRFHSYYYYYYSGYRGFKLSYSAGFASNCSDSGYYLSRGSTGVITSPNYPNNFPGYSECFNYLFTDDDNIRTRITFDQLRLESSDTCRNVFIKLTCHDGGENVQTVCGTRIPAAMTFDCRSLQIWFKSNATTSFNPRNYKLRYYAVTQNPSVTPRLLSAETDLPHSSKLGIGLGVGVGGFFLIILIVIIIFLIVSGQRQTDRTEQRRMEELAVICKSINSGGGSDPAVTIRNLSEPPEGSAEGFNNPMATDSVEKIWKK